MKQFITLVLILSLYGCNTKEEEQTKLPSGELLTKEMVDRTTQKAISDMVFVRGGTFMMGDVGGPDGYPWTVDKDNKPPHKVTLDSYYIGKFEITYAEHDIYTTSTGRKATKSKYKYDWRKPEVSAGVSWSGAEGYCAWIGEQTGLPFALPTEAQWEYAARNRGEHIGYATDNGKMEPGRNYHESIKNPISPGQYPPNPLGLYDMAGSNKEWLNDWYAPDYYKNSPTNNPKGPKTGTKKALREGGYHVSPSLNVIYMRRKELPEKEFTSTGFRCAIQSSEPPEVLFKNLPKHLRPE